MMFGNRENVKRKCLFFIFEKKKRKNPIMLPFANFFMLFECTKLHYH